MNIFVICHVADPVKIEATLAGAFPGDFYPLGGGQWLVAAPQTAQSVTNILQIGPGNAGVVFNVANYWGHAEPNLWEWLKTKFEQTSG